MTAVALAVLERILGGLGPVTDAVIEATYWAGNKPYTAVTGAEVQFPSPIVIEYTGQAVTLDMQPTARLCCVRWVIRDRRTGLSLYRYTEIPDGAPVDFGDLVTVRPDTFEPSAEGQAAWEGVVADALAAVAAARAAEAAAEASVTVAAASAAAATASASDAALSAEAADDSAGAAVGSASTALTAQAGAETARTGAETARTGAEAARDLALAGQFAGTLISTVANFDTYTTPGVYRFTSVASGAGSTNPPRATTPGVMEVFFLANGVYVQRYSLTNGWGEYSRSLAGSNWSPWRFIPSQRVDQTAGRAIYTWDDLNNREQLVYGDTGWRNITAQLINGWTATSVKIRRIGSVVHLRFQYLSTQTATAAEAFQIPTGFGNSDWLAFVIPEAPASFRIEARNGYIGAANAATAPPSWRLPVGSRYAEISWVTDQPWPTTLPGTAIGTIPT